MRGKTILVLGAAWLLTGAQAHAGQKNSDQARANQAPNRSVQVGDPAPWVLPPPAPGAQAPASDAALVAIHNDIQYFEDPNGQEAYSAIRYRIAKPQGLAAGNVTFTWSPDAGRVVLHRLRVIHGETVRDLTRSAQFTILQREQNLEQAALDGRLTAAYQIPALEVGDEVDLAFTTFIRDPTLPEARGDLVLLAQNSLSGALRLRVNWPKGHPLHWKTTPDLAPTPLADGFSIEMRDPPAPAELPVGAPARFGWRRLIEFTSYADWPTFSRSLSPLYEKAARLSADSPIKVEIARIAAASPDPTTRVEAALRLVEEQVRYVYVGMDGANLTPADADLTWQRRFGDCKGKTVLLLALLRGLGITAEPLLIQSKGGDGLSDRLPNPALFDHVVVRAKVGDKAVLLDGTRLGDRSLAQLILPPWRQGLPITPEGADIATLGTPPPVMPRSIALLDIDASAGIKCPRQSQGAAHPARRRCPGDPHVPVQPLGRRCRPRLAQVLAGQ